MGTSAPSLFVAESEDGNVFFKCSAVTTDSDPSIDVCKGDLGDVIVVCLSSEHLLNAICKASGNFFRTSFIAVKAEEQLAPKKNSTASLNKSI
ncbi:unnamed protein product [Rotaria socialis]|uniref:Uncharacterized protein n=1 Tax=Rotaria socialis TaxID=392032 RepID=A0A820MU46_9BILA|nr:unnamed protein product [Rotaria socialis]